MDIEVCKNYLGNGGKSQSITNVGTSNFLEVYLLLILVDITEFKMNSLFKHLPLST